MKRSQQLNGNAVQIPDLRQIQRVKERVIATIQADISVLLQAARDTANHTNENSFAMSQIRSIELRMVAFDAERIGPLLSILSEKEVVSRLSREMLGLPVIRVDAIPFSEWLGQPGQSSAEREGAWLAHVQEIDVRMDAYAKQQEEAARQAFSGPAILTQAEIARQRQTQTRETKTIHVEALRQVPAAQTAAQRAANLS